MPNFREGSGNIASPSKSENWQDDFQDPQEDFVVFRVIMLHLTSHFCLFRISGARSYPWLPPRGGSRASGWRSLRDERQCARFEISIFLSLRTLPQSATLTALDVLLAKLDRCLQHDSRMEPFG